MIFANVISFISVKFFGREHKLLKNNLQYYYYSIASVKNNYFEKFVALRKTIFDRMCRLVTFLPN